MSNPHVPGKQTNAQGQYGLSNAQVSPYLGLRSSIRSFGALVVPANTEGAALPQKPLPGSALDLNVQGRMDVRQADPDACFTSTQRDLFPSSSTGVTHLMPSDFKRHGYTDPENGSGSTNWFLNCKSSTSDNSSKSIPDCNYDTQVLDKQTCSGFSDASYFRQLAIQILQNYGLGKEVLDELILYPEDKTTAENLPHTLQQIYLRKTMKSTAVESAPCSEPQPSTSESGLGKLSTSADTGMGQDTSHSLIVQERKVFDSGYLHRCNTGLEEYTGHAMGSTNNGGNEMEMEMDTYNHTSYTCESLQASTAEGLSTALISSHDQMGSVVPPSSVLTKQLPANEDKGLRMHMFEVSKSFNLKEAVHQSTPPTQQITNHYIQAENSEQRNDVLMAGNDYIGTNVKSKTQSQNSEDAEPVKKHTHEQVHQQQGLEALTQMGIALLPQAFTAVTPPSFNSSATDSPFPVLHSEFITSDPCLSVVRPSHEIPGSINIPNMSHSNWHSPAKKSLKVLPSPAMIQDYAGATPRMFSHICSLCKKECANMKDWISHLKTFPHLENCKRLQQQYPGLDEHVGSISSSPDKNAWTLSSNYLETSQHYLQKKKHEGSKSPQYHHENVGGREKVSYRPRSPHSPRHRRRSRSRSWSPRHGHPTYFQSRSRSGSHERQCSPKSKGSKWSSTRSSSDRHSSPRSHKQRSSPRRSRERRSSPRRSHERRSSPRRNREQRSSPRRSCEQRSSPSRSCEQGSSPKKSHEQQSPKRRHEHRRGDEKSLSPKTGDEKPSRRTIKNPSSPRIIDENLPSPIKIDEKPSTPGTIDEKPFSPRTNDEKPSLPRADDEKLSSTIIVEKPSSPKMIDEKPSLSGTGDTKTLSPWTGHDRRSSPKRNHDRSLSSSRNEEPSSSMCWKQQLSDIKSDKSPSPRIKRKRPSSPKKYLPQEKKSGSIETMTKSFLKTSAVQSLSEQPNINELVDQVVARLLARSPSSTSLPEGKVGSSSPVCEEGSSSTSATPLSSPSKTANEHFSSNCSKENRKILSSEKSSSTKSQLGKRAAPTMVKLKGNFDTLCRSDVVSAVGPFGKTKSVLLFKPKQEASVCFEREEDAEKLRSVKSLDVKGISIIVAEKENVSERPPLALTEEQKLSTQQPADSSFTTTQTDQLGSAGKMVLLPIKALLSIPKRAKITATGRLVSKAKLLVSKAKNVSTKKMSVKTLKTSSIAVKGIVKSCTVKKEASKLLGFKRSKIPGKSFEAGEGAEKSVIVQKQGSKFPGFMKPKRAEEQSDPGDAKQKPTAKKSVVALTETAEVENPSHQIVAEPISDKEVVTETTVLTFKVERNLPIRATNIQVDNSAAKGNASDDKLEKSADCIEEEKGRNVSDRKSLQIQSSCKEEGRIVAKVTNMMSKSLPEHQTGTSDSFKAKKIETEIEALGKTRDTSATEMEHQSEITKVNTESEEGSKILEPQKVGVGEFKENETSPVDGDKKKITNDLSTVPSDCHPPTIAVKTTSHEPQSQQTTIKPSETLVEASPQVQQSVVQPLHKSTIQELKMNMHGLQKQQQAAGSSVGSVVQKAVTSAFTKVAACDKTKPDEKTASTRCKMRREREYEKREMFLSPHQFNCVSAQAMLSTTMSSYDSTLLLITNLPKNGANCYTEADLVNVLCKFGFDYTDDNIYILPQKCIAFALMPNVQSVQDILIASTHQHLVFKGHALHLHVVKEDILMTPLGFYNTLMKFSSYTPRDDGACIIYIHNISPREARDLRETLTKISGVKNCLLLLNKVFIEFNTIYDADRLGVWYSLLKRGFVHTVSRMKMPQSKLTSEPPRCPTNAVPDSCDIVAGAKIPTAHRGVPQGSTAPFWITMTTIPYVFPTAAPWFNIPNILTIQDENDINRACQQASTFSTIMLTGLPVGNYTHEDVVKLVWQYLPQRTLPSLYYKVMILPLQRRAFVYFCNWDLCCSFAQDHIRNPVAVRGSKLTVHFVLEDMHLGSSEEVMYRTLLQWSNVYVPEIASLEDRLITVEVSEISVDLIKKVMKEVASVACFVSFLPLGNRICIEMVESIGVTQVMEKSLSVHPTWSKVGRVEPLKNLKRRLQDSSDVIINLKEDTTGIHAEPATAKTGSHPSVSESTDKEENTASDNSAASPSFAVSESLNAGPSATTRGADPPEPLQDSIRTPGIAVEASSQIQQEVTTETESALHQETETGASQKQQQPAGSSTEAKIIKLDVEMKEGTKTFERGEKGAAESMEAENSAQGDGEKEKDSIVLPTALNESHPQDSAVETTSDEALTDLPQSQQTTIKASGTLVKATSQVRPSVKPHQESTGQELKTKTGGVQKQKHPEGLTKQTKIQKNVEPETGQKVETPARADTSRNNDTTTVAPRQIQTNPAPNASMSIPAVETKLSTSVKTKPEPVTPASSSAADSSTSSSLLTLGERIEHLLNPGCISCLNKRKVTSVKPFSLNKRVILITNLPEYHDDCYTEADVAILFHSFGFQYEDKNIFVIPQMRMAFLLMPSFKSVQDMIKASKTNPINLNGSRLSLGVVAFKIVMTPFLFYKSLMNFINFEVADKESVVFIQNISPRESRDLRQALRKIECVRNILPLLNKVFVEFYSARDADRLGVWYSLLKRDLAHNVYRMKVPQGPIPSLPPRLAAKAMPDSSEIVDGAVVPTTNFGVPLGSTSPFWVTMRAIPHVFPTLSPWFIIPNFLTVKESRDVGRVGSKAVQCSTIMLTGLPERDYSHKDIAKLVWRYFPEKNLHTLYYKVVVLPLQRRAFVYFNDWDSCHRFAKDHSTSRVSVKGYMLNIHIVMEQMHPGSSEETMYRALMKWSNARVPELESLEERLLCVEISETSVKIIIMVMKAVVSIAEFISFLPLANRICIEMAEPKGVTAVVNNISHGLKPEERKKVRHVEPLKSFKQRLRDSNVIITNLDQDISEIKVKPPAVTCNKVPQSALQPTNLSPAQPAASAGSTISQPITAGPSTMVRTEDAQKASGKINTDSVTAPRAGKEASSAVSKDGSTGHADQTAQSYKENLAEAGTNVPSTSPALEILNTQKSETKVQKSAVVPDNTATVVEMRALTDPDVKQQPVCAPDDAEEKEVKGETGVPEPMEVESFAEEKGANVTDTRALTAELSEDPIRTVSPPNPSDDQPQKPQTVHAPSKVQNIPKPPPESTSHGSKILTTASHKHQQPAGSSAAAQTVRSEANAKQKDFMETPNNPAPAAVSKVSASVALSAKTQPDKKPEGHADGTASSAEDASLTPGEKLAHGLLPIKNNFLSQKTIISPKIFSVKPKVLCLSNLPEYYDGYYKESDIVKLLGQYWIQCDCDKIFVFPHLRMAFVLLPTSKTVQDAFKATVRRKIILRGSELCFDVPSNHNSSTLITFYRNLMRHAKFKANADGENIIYIKNISSSEIRDLKEALTKIGSVRNYLPFLNKVLVEFESACDADRLGVWYSLLKRPLTHDIRRMGIPRNTPTLLPRLTAQALPESKYIAPGVMVPRAKSGVPQNTIPPFWVTMATSPYVFPTASPWFNIPVFRTVCSLSTVDIKKLHHPNSKFSTIMLTGFPDNTYLHEDVAKLVWKYFTERTLHSLNYNVTVLPLQRRAFLFFNNWDACRRFIEDHIKNPVSVNGCTLSVHLVLENMHTGSSEEMYYRIMMKWSNTLVAEQPSLEERLLCVETSEMNLYIATMVLEEVAGITAFVSFLPLANRMYIEMAESSGVTEVVEKLSLSKLSQKSEAWKNIGHIETLESRKQRLQDCKKITVNLEPDIKGINMKLPTLESGAKTPPNEGTQPGTETGASASGGSSTEPITGSPDAMRDSVTDEKCETAITVDSTPAAYTNDRVAPAEEKTEEKVEEKTAGQMEEKMEGKTKNKMEGNTEEKTEGKMEEEMDGKTGVKVEEKTAGQMEEKMEGKTKNKMEGKMEGKTKNKIDGNMEEKTAGQMEEKMEGKTGNKMEGKTEEKMEGKMGEKMEEKTGGKVEEKMEGKTEGKMEQKTEEKMEGSPACSALSDGGVDKSVEPIPDLPQIDENAFSVIKAALHQYRITRGCTEDSNKEVQDDFKDSSDVFDEGCLNLEDFVTVDEIVEDVEEKADDYGCSSSEQTCREKRKRQSSDSSPAAKKTSTSASKYSRSSASCSSSATSSSKPTKSSLSSRPASGSPNKQKDYSSPTKSQTSPSSSVSDSKTSVPSSLSPLQREQLSKTKSPITVTHPSSAGRHTRSSSAAAKTFLETPRTHEGTKSAKSGLAKPDQEASAEPSAAKTVESETKTKVVNKSRNDGVHTEENGDGGKNNQIHSSFTGQTGEEMQKEENQESNTEIQTPGLVEGFEGDQQVLDSVEEKGETCREIEMDASLKVNESSTLQKKDNSPRKQDRTVKNHEMQTTDVTTGRDKDEDDHAEEMLCEVVDAAEDESVRDASASGRLGRRRHARGLKEGKKTSPETVATEDLTIMTRSTRARREKMTEIQTRRKTAARDSLEPDRQKTPKTEDAPLKRNTPTKKRDSFMRDTSERTDEKEEARTRTRSQTRKRPRLAPVTKSTSGKKDECPDTQTPEGCTEEEADVKGFEKRKMDDAEAEEKRSRSPSPSVAADLKLPPFNPKIPLGQEFVVPKWGYFCKICSVSYMKDDATEDLHCKSQMHQENLQKYYQKSSRT